MRSAAIVTVMCVSCGCARLLDSTYEARFQALASPSEVLRTAEAELATRAYSTHTYQGRILSGSQSELTPIAFPAMAVGAALLPVSFVTWPAVLLMAGPISPGFAAWWPIYPLSIPDGATIHRNIQITADARTNDWTVVRFKGKADGKGIRDFKALHELLLREFQTCDPPESLARGATASSHSTPRPTDNKR